MNDSLWKQFRQLFQGRNFLFFLLIFTVLGSFAGTVSAVVQHVGWGFLVPSSLYGIFFGWILAHFEVGDRGVACCGVLIGILVAVFRAGTLREPFFHFLQVSGSLVRGWVKSRDLSQFSALFEAWNQLYVRTGGVLNALWQWVLDVMGGAPEYSLLATRFVWGLAMWGLSMWLSWSIRRYHRPMWGFLPVGTLMGILLTYIPGERLYLLALTLGASLALLGLGFFERRKVEWDQRGIPYYARVEKNFTSAVLLVSVFVMAFAVSIPSVSVDALTDPIQEWNRRHAGEGEVMESLGVEFRSGPAVAQLANINQLPRSHLIGLSPDLGQRVVMVVKFPGMVGDPGSLPKEARYWRAFTYDQYTGFGWTSSSTIEKRYAPGQVMNVYNAEYTSKVVQEILLKEKIVGPVYAPGMPLTVNREYQTFWRTTSLHPEEVGEKELEFEDIFTVSVDSDHYQVESVIPRVGEDVLRNTDDNYPEWIRERYINLPQKTPHRVLEFATRLVENETTNYDKAKTIESFLRTYEYTLDIPPPPREGDLVDYFLFRLEKGYCDYYASSMVVLARAVGIPARLAVGYVDGTYDAEGDRLLVTESQAHSWPELYFTGLGWIPFEPTAQRAVIEHEDKPLPVPPELEEPPGQGIGIWGVAGGIGRAASGLFLIALVVIGTLIMWYDPWTLRQGSTTETLVIIFHRLYRFGHWLELGLGRPVTPFQFERALKARLSHLTGNIFREGSYSNMVTSLRQLADMYVESYYGPSTPGREVQREVIRIWKKLRWQLLVALIAYHSQETLRKAQVPSPSTKRSPVE